MRTSLSTIRESPHLPGSLEISGWVYDCRTGRLTEVAEVASPPSRLVTAARTAAPDDAAGRAAPLPALLEQRVPLGQHGEQHTRALRRGSVCHQVRFMLSKIAPRPCTTRMRVRLEVGFAPAPIRNMRVDLGRAEVSVPEHLLHAAQVGSALEQVGRERVPEEVRVDALGLEPCLRGEPADDEKRARRG